MIEIDLAKLAGEKASWPKSVLRWIAATEAKAGDRSLAILEVSGLDSLAAAAVVSRYRSPKPYMIPSVASVPSEFGNRVAFVKQVRDTLEATCGAEDVAPIAGVRDYRLWTILNGQYLPSILQRFQLYSPCIGCHVYVHVLRILLAKLVGAHVVVSGERLLHDASQKINQMSISMSAHRQLFQTSGITLVTPLLEIASGHEVKRVIGAYDNRHDMSCAFSSRLTDRRGVLYDVERLAEYYCSFVVPAALAYLDWSLLQWSGEYKAAESLSDYVQQRVFA